MRRVVTAERPVMHQGVWHWLSLRETSRSLVLLGITCPCFLLQVSGNVETLVEVGFCSCSALADLLLSCFARQHSLCCRLSEGSGFSLYICFEGWEVCKVLARAVSLGGTRLT